MENGKRKEIKSLIKEADEAHRKLMNVVERLEHKFLEEEIGQEPFEMPKPRPMPNGKHE
jgi:hypothetical protein